MVHPDAAFNVDCRNLLVRCTAGVFLSARAACIIFVAYCSTTPQQDQSCMTNTTTLQKCWHISQEVAPPDDVPAIGSLLCSGVGRRSQSADPYSANAMFAVAYICRERAETSKRASWMIYQSPRPRERDCCATATSGNLGIPITRRDWVDTEEGDGRCDWLVTALDEQAEDLTR